MHLSWLTGIEKKMPHKNATHKFFEKFPNSINIILLWTGSSLACLFISESHVLTVQDMEGQVDNSSVSLSHRDSMSCDNMSELESIADHAASNRSDDIRDTSRSIMWQNVSTEDVGLTTGTYRQYHQKLLKQDEKRHINLLRKK